MAQPKNKACTTGGAGVGNSPVAAACAEGLAEADAHAATSTSSSSSSKSHSFRDMVSPLSRTQRILCMREFGSFSRMPAAILRAPLREEAAGVSVDRGPSLSRALDFWVVLREGGRGPLIPFLIPKADTGPSKATTARWERRLVHTVSQEPRGVSFAPSRKAHDLRTTLLFR
ncbi:hypothetical protein Esti_000847 [Eimeria stiedai]